MYISETQHPRLSYAKMGYFDKATARASKQNSLLMSREVLLSLANEERQEINIKEKQLLKF